MTNESLLQALARSGLIADDVLAALQRQMATGAGKLDPAAIVGQLVTDGHLTKAQGARLLSQPAAPSVTMHVEPDDELEVLDEEEPSRPKPVPWASAGPQPTAADDLEVVPDEHEDLLPPPPPPPSPAAPKKVVRPSASLAETRAANDDLGLAPLDEDPLLSSPLQPRTSGGSTPARKSAAPTPTGKKTPPKKRRTWRNEVAPAAPELADQVDDLLGHAAADADGASAAERRQKRRAMAGPRNSWDSPLLLLGGGTLVGMLLLGAVLLWVMKRQTGDQSFELAEEAYKSGSFVQAISMYDQFLEKYPKHGSVSVAKVHRGLAEMRQAAEGARDWSKTLATTQTALNQISPEVEFPSAQTDLASILLALAQGLANQTRDKPSATLVDQTREAVALVDKFVPITLQPAEQMRDIAASLAMTVRRLDRDKALAAAIGKMQEAIQAGTLPAVYATRRELLQSYPELADDPKLIAEMVAAAERERAGVKFVAETRAAEVTDAPSLTLASLALTSTKGAAAPIDDPPTMTILDSGSVFGIEPRTGKPRWRRFVGFDTEHAPQVIKTAAGPAALLVDSVQEGIALVDAVTGKLRWRQKIDGGHYAAPVVVRDRVLLASRAGKLLVMDLETGELRGYIQLPQALRVGPIAEPRERLYYQVAEYANLYVLAAENGECREVFYLGHEPETISAPPLLVGRYVILVVNSGAEDSVLRVLLADEDGLKLKAVDQMPLRGHVFSSPVVSGRALIVATDRGALYSIELGAPDGGKILTKLAEKPPDDKPPIVPFLAARGSELWLAGYGLTRYDVQASRGALAPKWIDDDQAVVLHPPAVVGPAVIFVTRSPRTAGASVSAINGVDASRFWETRLGVPLAAPPIVTADASKAVVMTAVGSLYEVPAAGLANRKLMDTPAATISEKFNLQPDLPLVQLPDGRCVFTQARADAPTDLRELLIYDPRSSNDKLRRKTLSQAVAAQPAAFGEGLLVPAKIGQVLLVDPDTGRNLIEPFQPIVEVGVDVAWTEPAVFDDKQALISDGATKLYRLAVADAPRAHLEAAATVELAVPLVSTMASAGNFAYGVDRGNRLISFRLPDLAPAKDWPLDARAVWGPTRVGNYVLVATLAGQLTCVDGTGELKWQVPLGAGGVIGSPLESRGEIVAGSNSGSVYRIAPDTGKVVSEIALGQPLALGPVRWHDRLLFAGSDGTLYVVAEPK
jgi:outer membrane protein assembly factor BamB